MEIWYRKPTLAQLNERCKETLAETLAMEYTEIGADYLAAKMPVDRRTHQVLKLLHGGASVALAETVGSAAAQLTVDPKAYFVVGQSIFSTHLRPVRSGFVYAVTRPIHLGRKTQVWDIDVTDDNQNRIHASRLTLAVLPNNGKITVPSFS
jgi:1,4-dihydroxy-2-naphthoyl-CoA hydrolase